MERRKLDLRSGDELIAEIDRLASSGYSKAGQWSLTQMCEHLDKTMTGGMDGFNFRLPWIVRATIGAFLTRDILKNRRMRRFSAPKPVRPKSPASETDDPEIIARCKETVRRAMDFKGPLPPYPLVNNLSVENWKQLMWIHAGHHLSFLVPSGKRD